MGHGVHLWDAPWDVRLVEADGKEERPEVRPRRPPRRDPVQRAWARTRAVTCFGWVFFLISSGSPHVRPMGRTCGAPGEIELAPVGVKLNGSRSVPFPHGASASSGPNCVGDMAAAPPPPSAPAPTPDPPTLESLVPVPSPSTVPVPSPLGRRCACWCWCWCWCWCCEGQRWPLLS